MEIKITKETKKELQFEIEGVGHTFCNALKEALYNNKDVEAASYTIDHPLISLPRFIVVTDGKVSPKDALLKAVKSIKSQNSKVEKIIAKVAK